MATSSKTDGVAFRNEPTMVFHDGFPFLFIRPLETRAENERIDCRWTFFDRIDQIEERDCILISKSIACCRIASTVPDSG